jgi:cyanoexosortase B-associated protein
MASRTERSLSMALPEIWIKGALVILLTALASAAIVPAYLTGQWPWVTAPQVAQLDQLKALGEQGLTLQGWSRQSHQAIAINGKDWSFSEYIADQPAQTAPTIDQFALLMRPQPWHSDQPEVEWLDLQGAQHWKLKTCRNIKIAPTTNPIPQDFTARLCRASNDQQTLALLQWYAWPSRGHPAPSHWFWANQWTQFRDHRLTPWVAATVLVPMDPMADLSTYKSPIATLGSNVQQQIMVALSNNDSTQ